MKTESSIVPFDFNGAEIRTLTINGLPWFIVVDVCRVLGLADPSSAIRDLDDDEKMTLPNMRGHSGRGGAQKLNAVNESGLYALIFKSRKAEARKFKKWVTAEVLPSIRQTGGYSVHADPMSQLNALVKSIVQNAFTNGASAGALKMIVPLGRYGELSKNGLPKTGIRRAAYVAASSRTLEAARLVTQLQLFELMREGDLALTR